MKFLRLVTFHCWLWTFPGDSVRTLLSRAALLGALLALSGFSLDAQSWDGATQAAGWAHQDKDDSFTFYDQPSGSLRTWSREGGLQRSTPLGKLPGAPEKWAIDPHNNHWVISGLALSHVGPSGKILKTSKLPAEVADVSWDVKGFVLSYRAPEPYVEKRDFSGSVLWSHGVKPAREEGPAPLNLRPILIDEAGNVLLASGPSLNLLVLEGTTGRKLTEIRPRLADGSPAPLLEGSVDARGPLVLWPGNEVVFAAVKATQVPLRLREGLQGLVLARLDLKKMRLEFLPTGLDEAHLLVGLLDSDAVFVSPRGGLVLVKVR